MSKIKRISKWLASEPVSSIKSSCRPEDFAGISEALVSANAKKYTSHPPYVDRLKRPIKKRVALFLILLPGFTL
jgi:hypothetical protein